MKILNNFACPLSVYLNTICSDSSLLPQCKNYQEASFCRRLFIRKFVSKKKKCLRICFSKISRSDKCNGYLWNMPERSAIRLFFLEEKIIMQWKLCLQSEPGVDLQLSLVLSLFPSLNTLDDFAQRNFVVAWSFRQIPQLFLTKEFTDKRG